MTLENRQAYTTLSEIHERVGTLTPNSPEQKRKAGVTVAAVALDQAWPRDDLKDVLEALGLLGDEDEEKTA